MSRVKERGSPEEIEIELDPDTLAIVECKVTWDNTPPEYDVNWPGGPENVGADICRVTITRGHDAIVLLDVTGREGATFAWAAVCRDYPGADAAWEKALDGTACDRESKFQEDEYGEDPFGGEDARDYWEP